MKAFTAASYFLAVGSQLDSMTITRICRSKDVDMIHL